MASRESRDESRPQNLQRFKTAGRTQQRGVRLAVRHVDLDDALARPPRIKPVLAVIAHYTVRAGSGDAVAEALATHVAATRAEPGCVAFDALRSLERADVFVLHEVYVDEAAFLAHRGTPHFRAYVEETIVPLLEERRWERFEVIDPR